MKNVLLASGLVLFSWTLGTPSGYAQNTNGASESIKVSLTERIAAWWSEVTRKDYGIDRHRNTQRYVNTNINRAAAEYTPWRRQPAPVNGAVLDALYHFQGNRRARTPRQQQRHFRRKNSELIANNNR